METWKTYNNEEIGFEFEYPGDWFLEKGSESAFLKERVRYPSFWNLDFLILRPAYSRLPEYIFIEIHSKIRDPNQPYEFFPPTAAAIPVLGKDLEKYKISIGKNTFYYGEGQFEGVWSIKYETLSEDLSRVVEFTMKIVGGRQKMNYYLSKEEIAPELEIFNKILSTFKFKETANWKTYRNEEYGFEFKYPPIPTGCENCKIQKSKAGFSVNRTFLSIDDLGELTLSEFVDKEIERFEVERKEKVLIGDKEGIRVDYRFGEMGRFRSAAFVKRNKKVIIFEFTAGGFCCDSKVDRIYEMEVYDAMLSTFRFLE